MSKLQNESATIAPRQHLGDFPEYKEALDKFNALKLRHLEIEKQMSELLSGNVAKQSLLEKKAVAMLDGKSTSFSGSMRLQRNVDETASQLREERTVLFEAMRMQTETLQNVKRKVSKEIAEQLLPQHRKNVAELCNALVQVAVAAAREDDLRMDLHSRDVEFASVLRPMAYSRLGRLDGHHHETNIGIFLREALEYGFIGRRELVSYGMPQERIVEIMKGL